MDVDASLNPDLIVTGVDSFLLNGTREEAGAVTRLREAEAGAATQPAEAESTRLRTAEAAATRRYAMEDDALDSAIANMPEESFANGSVDSQVRLPANSMFDVGRREACHVAPLVLSRRALCSVVVFRVTAVFACAGGRCWRRCEACRCFKP